MRDINVDKQIKSTSSFKSLDLNKSLSNLAKTNEVKQALRNIEPINKLKKIQGTIDTVANKLSPLMKISGLDEALGIKTEIGSFGSKVVFEVSSFSQRTFQNFKTGASAKYADIELLEGRPRKQFIAPANKTVSFDITLRVDNNWLSPRDMRTLLIDICEKGEANYLIIGGKPVSTNPFVLTSVSDEWGVIFNDGSLFSINLSLSLEEYDPKSHLGE